MGRVLHRALQHRLLPPQRRIQRFLDDAVGTQAAVLRRLLAEAADTTWGRRFRFGELAREPDVVRAFQACVPLGDYATFRDDIQRMRQGEPDVLCRGRVRGFATSAGTTSQAKSIPAPQALLRANLRHGAAALVSYLAETGQLACLGGMPLALTGCVQRDPERPEIRAGEISGLGAEYWARRGLLRKWVLRRKSLPTSFLFEDDWDRKLDGIVEYTMDRDVRLVCMVPSWGLQLFDRLIDRYNRKHGTRGTTIGDIWPNLALVIAGGVPLGVYREMLQERIGSAKVAFVEVYGASEAPIAFQASQADSAMVLHLNNGVFFEFLRHEEFGTEHPRRLGIADVETGVDYVPVVSTCGGLWAYCLGDVVRFTETFPHKIMVVGRTAEILDSYGEFVLGSQAREALGAACARTEARVLEFHLAPRPALNGRPHAHQWLIEFDAPPLSGDDFVRKLDAALQQRNPMYACCRREKGLGLPEVVPVDKGVFYDCLQRNQGKIGAQTKVPCMSDNRRLADRVLEINPSNS